MWRHLFPDGGAEPVGYVTNGVHTASWVGPEMRTFYAQHIDPAWEQQLLEPEVWQKVREAPDAALWAAHRAQKERLIRFVRERVRVQSARHGLSPGRAAAGRGAPRPPRPHDRLRPALRHLQAGLPDHVGPRPPASHRFRHRAAGAVPVRGQGAPRRPRGTGGRPAASSRSPTASSAGSSSSSRTTTSRSAAPSCRAATCGSTRPRRPQEASGTSGQKVPVNGGVNLSVLDGWWAEGFRGDNGWAIGDGEHHPGHGGAGPRPTPSRSTGRWRPRSYPASSPATRPGSRASGSAP